MFLNNIFEVWREGARSRGFFPHGNSFVRIFEFKKFNIKHKKIVNDKQIFYFLLIKYFK